MNPFEVDAHNPANAQQSAASAVSQATRPLAIDDTQSIDGLAVHLQSPSIRRRYWETRHAERFQQLTQMAQAAEDIEAYLVRYSYTALLGVFHQEMAHHAQLKTLRETLQLREEHVTLSSIEQRLLVQARQLGELGTRLGRWIQGFNKQAVTDGDKPLLPPHARRSLQRWLHQFTSTHTEPNAGLSPDVIQDIYRLQHYL